MKVFTVKSTPVKTFLRELINYRGMPVNEVTNVPPNIKALEKLAERYNLQLPAEVKESNKANFYKAVLSYWKSTVAKIDRFMKSI